MSPRRALTYRHPRASERLAQVAIPALRSLEALNLRRAWWRLSTMVLAHAYLLGMTEAMPSLDDFRTFMAPVLEGAGAQTVDIELDSAGSLDLPPGEPGWLTLSLSVAGTQVASVVAPEPGAQWDWPALTARVV